MSIYLYVCKERKNKNKTTITTNYVMSQRHIDRRNNQIEKNIINSVTCAYGVSFVIEVTCYDRLCTTKGSLLIPRSVFSFPWDFHFSFLSP